MKRVDLPQLTEKHMELLLLGLGYIRMDGILDPADDVIARVLAEKLNQTIEREFELDS